MWKESASHIPVLILLSKIRQITRILEYGSGELSTKLFLDRIIFKDLQILDSIEDDPEWFERMNQLKDDRFTLHHTRDTVKDLNSYDLVFIDGPQFAPRAPVIELFNCNVIGKNLLVIHDFEHVSYQVADVNFAYKYVFDYIVPYTAVFSMIPLPAGICERNHQIMKSRFNEVEEDRLIWKDELIV